MARTFNGQVHVRINPQVHEEIAKEAFAKGGSISGIISQALTARSILKNTDPWKSVDEIWDSNHGVNEKKLEADIRRAIKAVRKKRRRV